MGVKFFRKNFIDLSNRNALITITDAVASDNGQDFVNLLRDRKNTSGWGTTGSSDAALTEILIDLGSHFDVNRLVLVNHNFKSYTIQFFNPDTEVYQNLNPTISPTVNAVATTYHEFETVSTRYFKIVISSTIIEDADKLLSQVIITEELGELIVEPEIRPIFDRSRKSTKYLSGKRFIATMPQTFGVMLRMNNVIEFTDLDLIERLSLSYEGFLVWLCGGNVSIYPSERFGYRLEDIFLVNSETEYLTEYEESRYANGMPINMQLREIV